MTRSRRGVRLASLLILGWSPRAAASGGPATDAYDDTSKTAAVDLLLFGDVNGLRNFDDPASGKNQLRFDFNSNQLLAELPPGRARAPPRRMVSASIWGWATPPRFTSNRIRLPRPIPCWRARSRTSSRPSSRWWCPSNPSSRSTSAGSRRPWESKTTRACRTGATSRSLLYSWAEPSLHTGLRLSSQATDRPRVLGVLAERLEQHRHRRQRHAHGRRGTR